MSVTVGIVTWNSASVIEACLASVRAQTYRPLTLRVLDNASGDDTRARLAGLTDAGERLDADRNLGFSAAHNRLIAASASEFYLCLNPDVELAPDFLEHTIAAMQRDPEAGSATGKLLRTKPPHPNALPASGERGHDDRAASPSAKVSRHATSAPSPRVRGEGWGEGSSAGPPRDGAVDVIDSTGIIMLPSQRHLDRGADSADTGQYARAEYVFGASGAAACYRRAMLDDVGLAIGGDGDGPVEYFDEDFFAYREDADLAWRAQLLGWRCLYVPDAVARHGRRVTPERRGALPAAINAWSVRNRFLLRIKNQTAGHALRFALPTLARDLQVIGYVLLKERTSLGALGDVVRLLPRTWAKRRAIMARRKRPTREMIAWFRAPDRP